MENVQVYYFEYFDDMSNSVLSINWAHFVSALRGLSLWIQSVYRDNI